MNKLIVLALALMLNPVFAATGISAKDDGRSALMEGCAALKSAAKRAKCFETLARTPVQQDEQVKPEIPRKPVIPEKSAEEIENERIASIKKKFEGVNRAATAIKSATDVGVSYAQYGPYIQQLATEVALVKQNANGRPEASAVLLLERAIEAYRDAGAFWGTSIEFFSGRGNHVAYSGGLPLDLTGMEWVASKYDIPTQNADIWGLSQGIPQGVGVTTIWRKAQKLVESANATLAEKQ